VGWVFYSRWAANQAIAEKTAEKGRCRINRLFEAMGGNRFEILVFAANPPDLHVGEKKLYFATGVSNAKGVKIRPANGRARVARVQPVRACFAAQDHQIHPHD